MPVFVAGETELAPPHLPESAIVPLDDIIANSLFEETVDISDLFPSILEPAPREMLALDLREEDGSLDMAGDLIDLPDMFFAPTAPLAPPLFDDDMGHIAL
ncbi:hypothetical protein N7E70_028585 (plasmid) [Aminobacter sp. NyZ550]|uniref:hypothetical protein n=1 Tax=Aminobacter sp. NyZ550 TaxID=2979870 RepID=UPI0021D605FE|nr:hypothetical protein [Aminobacter sp. NyZ550]WAX98075.1 hypothetical protein N7E70_028585 [Aminobacter sp. NyZ550]